MKSICIIPARGGSKRILKKNIKDFLGKPIISYSIDKAINSKLFDSIIVSTDDDEIAEISAKYGASIPFRRPDYLSDDYSTTLDVIKHAIEWSENRSGNIEFVCCLYPTAPFVEIRDLINAYEIIKNNQQSSLLISAVKYSYPIQRSFTISTNGLTKLYFEDYLKSRSQDLEAFYHDAGQFYLASKSTWKSIDNLIENAIPFLLPGWRVQDIDTLDDWKRAETMYKVLNESDYI